MKKKGMVCHFSTVHQHDDVRVFYRECLSLNQNGYHVTYVGVPTNTKRDNSNRVQLIDVKLFSNRLLRIMISPYRLIPLLLKLKAEVYHFHDPELILVGLILKLNKKKVIYDIHENVSGAIDTKYWIPKIVKPLVKFIFEAIEKTIIGKYDHLVLAEESYESIYSRYRTTTVLNMPSPPTGMENVKLTPPRMIYTGVISYTRGLKEMLDLVLKLNNNHIDVILELIGPIYDNKDRAYLEKFIIDNNMVNNIVVRGYLPNIQVYDCIRKSTLGLAILHPVPNYIGSLPTKIFEYMAMGVPVLTSNFPLYYRYVNAPKTGLCVDPYSPEEIYEAAYKLLTNATLHSQCSKNGRRAVKDIFHWRHEEAKLLSAYKLVLDS